MAILWKTERGQGFLLCPIHKKFEIYALNENKIMNSISTTKKYYSIKHYVAEKFIYKVSYLQSSSQQLACHLNSHTIVETRKEYIVVKWMGNDNQISQEIFDSFLTQLLQSKDTQNTDPKHF